ncbi:DUF397 domain-containing protein [Nocardia sp. NBC_00511]|uniref:DUF397 domain-containing protein n=1 Tax=Nocardia sp. NBC_00511 TaxID=2903591 RepID=UPI0030E373B1
MSIDLADARWFKSSRSGPNQDCVEAAHLVGGAVAVRDSKAGDLGPVLVFGPDAWDGFNSAVRAGKFDR